MSGAHIITASRSHARERLGRLAGLLRGHGDLPEGPDMDLQDHGDGMDITEALAQDARRHLGENGESPRPREQAGDPWWGETTMDWPPAHDRGYVLDPLGLYPPAVPQPDPGPQADLGRCIIWRDAVRDHFVRQERAHGIITAGPPWYVEYARIYRKRTGLVSVREPDFALHRWDHVVDEIMAQAEAATEAEWIAAQEAAKAHVTRQEYAARHAGRAA